MVNAKERCQKAAIVMPVIVQNGDRGEIGHFAPSHVEWENAPDLEAVRLGHNVQKEMRLKLTFATKELAQVGWNGNLGVSAVPHVVKEVGIEVESVAETNAQKEQAHRKSSASMTTAPSGPIAVLADNPLAHVDKECGNALGSA